MKTIKNKVLFVSKALIRFLKGKMSEVDEAVVSKDQDKLIEAMVKDVEKQINYNPVRQKTRLLFIPRYYQINFTRMMDIFWALALRLRGVEITPVLCNSFHCEECMIYGGNYKENRITLCRRDNYIARKIWIDLLKLKPLFLTDYRRAEDDQLAEEMASKISYENYRDANYKGYRLGMEAARAVANLNDTSMIENENNMIRQLKVHVKNIVRLINAYERALEHIKPDAIFSNIPFYYTWGTAFHAAREKDIPFYGIGMGERENSSYFVYNSGKIYDFTGGWDSFKNRELDRTNRELIDRMIFERKQGKHYGLPHYKKSNQMTDEYKKMLSWIDKGKPLVFFPVNVPSDATILGETYVFNSLYEMVIETIQYFNRHPDYQLIIKAHPAEEQFYASSSPMQKYCLRNILSKLREGISDNVFFVDFDSSITSFDIYPLIDLGIMYTSSAAIEMAWIGKPSITVAESHYAGKGFTYEPGGRKEYYEFIEKILLRGEPESVVKERIELSKKYFYYYFFHCLIKFNLFQGNDYNSIPTKFLFKDFSRILPGENEQLDYICDSIINKLPIYGENRWPPASF